MEFCIKTEHEEIDFIYNNVIKLYKKYMIYPDDTILNYISDMCVEHYDKKCDCCYCGKCSQCKSYKYFLLGKCYEQINNNIKLISVTNHIAITKHIATLTSENEDLIKKMLNLFNSFSYCDALIAAMFEYAGMIG